MYKRQEQDRERVREEFAKQAANYKKLALEYRICHKGPGELWVFNRGEIAEENGEPFFYCVILDVTDVHELKWFYKNILDSLPTALVILDEERRLTLINQSAEKLFHIRAEDCLGKTDQIGENGLDPAGGTTQEQYYLQEGRRWKLVRTPMVGLSLIHILPGILSAKGVAGTGGYAADEFPFSGGVRRAGRRGLSKNGTGAVCADLYD